MHICPATKKLVKFANLPCPATKARKLCKFTPLSFQRLVNFVKFSTELFSQFSRYYCSETWARKKYCPQNHYRNHLACVRDNKRCVALHFSVFGCSTICWFSYCCIALSSVFRVVVVLLFVSCCVVLYVLLCCVGGCIVTYCVVLCRMLWCICVVLYCVMLFCVPLCCSLYCAALRPRPSLFWKYSSNLGNF